MFKIKTDDVDHHVPVLDEKALPPCQNPDHLAGLPELKARKLEEEDHLTEITDHPNSEMN